jgi:hypothetical protein
MDHEHAIKSKVKAKGRGACLPLKKNSVHECGTLVGVNKIK